MAISQVRTVGLNGQQEVSSEWFVARITAVDAYDTGTGDCAGRKHEWIEQKVCKNGTAYEDAASDSAETGDFTNGNWAYKIGGGYAAVDDIVLMRYKSMNSDGFAIFEFIQGGGGAIVTQSVVTDVTCSGGTLVVTKKTISIPGGTVT